MDLCFLRRRDLTYVQAMEASLKAIGCKAAPRRAGETDIHRTAKLALARAFAARGLEVRTEAVLGDQRADVLVTSGLGCRVAVEVQHSPIEPDELAARTRAYHAQSVRALWIPTIDLAALSPTRLGPPRLLGVHRFLCPAWHQWIEAQQGSLWYWSEGALWQAWLTHRLVQRTARGTGPEWEEAEAARRAHALTLLGPFDAGALRLHPNPPAPGPDTRFNLVPGASAALVRAGESRPMPPPTELAHTLVQGRLISRLKPISRAA